jgi:hypothetical protein
VARQDQAGRRCARPGRLRSGARWQAALASAPGQAGTQQDQEGYFEGALGGEPEERAPEAGHCDGRKGQSEPEPQNATYPQTAPGKQDEATADLATQMHPEQGDRATDGRLQEEKEGGGRQRLRECPSLVWNAGALGPPHLLGFVGSGVVVLEAMGCPELR